MNKYLFKTATRFQDYLRKYEKDEELIVLQAINKPGMQFGECFTSLVIKTIITAIQGDGNPYLKSFMWKMICLSRPAASYLDISKLFRNEEHMYSNVLPVLGPFGPTCVYHDKQNIIMEDLTEKGYFVRFRRSFMDLSHTIFTLKSFARFHASSLVLKINDPKWFNEIVIPIEEAVYVDTSSSYVKQYISNSMQWIIGYIELIKPQTQASQAMINIFASYKDNAFDTFKQLFSGPKQKYDVICHGDTWLNNLLFLHDDNNMPIDMKFVDYQVPRYASVALDIHYFIYSSVQSSLIENSYESLIKIYHNTLLEELRYLDVSEEVLAELGEEWLEEGMKIYAFFGLTMGCWIMHALLATDEDIQWFEKMRLPSFDVKIIGERKEKIDRVKCIISHYYNRYHLDIRNDLEPLSVE